MRRWSDQSLDLHRVRLGLDEERSQLIRSAFRLSRFTARMFDLNLGGTPERPLVCRLPSISGRLWSRTCVGFW